MKRDGDLTQNPFPVAPDYQRWRRQLKELRENERQQRISNIIIACCQGVAMAVLILIFFTFLAW